MRTLVTIRKRGEGYIIDVAGKFGGGYSGRQCGINAYDAATVAAREMVEYGQSNPDGADLMAPPEVMEHVPTHWRKIDNPKNAKACKKCGYEYGEDWLDDGETCPKCRLVQ